MAKKEKTGADAEKPEKSAESKEVKESKSGKQEMQARWILGIMIILIIFVFIGAWIAEESKNFNFVGLDWEKEKFGKLTVYSAVIQGTGVQGQPVNFKIILKNDPRELGIPVEGKVFIFSKMPVFLALNLTSEIDKCEPTSLISLGYTMGGLGYDLQTAATTEEDAEENDLEFMTCENTDINTVITLTSGNESKITRNPEKRNCYTLMVKDCELEKVIEQFEIEILKGVIPNAEPNTINL